RQIAQYTATGRYDQPTEQERYRMIRMYFEMLLAESDVNGKEIQGKMKQFASWFTHGVAGGSALRKAIYEAKTGETILSAVAQFFEEKSQLAVKWAESPAAVAVACAAHS